MDYLSEFEFTVINISRLIKTKARCYEIHLFALIIPILLKEKEVLLKETFFDKCHSSDTKY